VFCVVDAESRGSDADNHLMSFPVRRSIKNPTGTRRNFSRRDWTSIGLRGARVTRGKTSTRTKIGLPGSSLSDAYMVESRIVGFDAPYSDPQLTTRTPSEKGWSELLWLGLILLAIAAAATVQMMQ
jgi:uncharacterized protein DUF4236